MATITAASADFATRLFDHVVRSATAKGLVLSPFSIKIALAMCAAGAKSNTRAALANLIDAPADLASQNRQFKEMLGSAQGRNRSGVQLVIANALWVERTFKLQPEFQKLAADVYDSACNAVDFRAAPDVALKSINTWVETKTAGRIKDLIKRGNIDADTRLILTNAIYFMGVWADPFDKEHTWDEDWHGTAGTRQTRMMHKRAAYPYCENADFQALDIPYAGDQLSLLLVLPRNRGQLSTLENKWASGHVYEQATSALTTDGEVMVSLPRFIVESEFSVKDALIAMGAAEAFGDQADFTGISADRLKISDVLHKAFIEVNEEGTEAAAATAVVMAKCAAIMEEPRAFVADHPFLYAIRDRQTNAILFCGRVLEPELASGAV